MDTPRKGQMPRNWEKIKLLVRIAPREMASRVVTDIAYLASFFFSLLARAHCIAAMRAPRVRKPPTGRVSSLMPNSSGKMTMPGALPSPPPPSRPPPNLPEPPKEELGLRSIYQNKGETINEFSAKVGSTVQMRVDGTEQTVTWTIEDTKIATVDANGLVTAVAKGKTILKATVGDQSVSCFVIVN